MMINKNIDIYATIGPSCWSDSQIYRLINAGVTGFRFPFSKESPEEHSRRLDILRKHQIASNATIIAIADLPGGKPRLTNKTIIKVNLRQEYQIQYACQLRYENILSVSPLLPIDSLSKNSRVWIGDGDNQFHVSSVSDGVASGKFMKNSVIQPTRAFLPFGSDFVIPMLTANDKELAHEASTAKYDAIALSFASDHKMIAEFRKWLKNRYNWSPQIIAKIETKQGVQNCQAIAEVSDKIMIGRGDLALNVGYEYLWYTQRSIIETCRSLNCYVIVATGFLDNLRSGDNPTRSQCIDISSTLDMGADALLLSAETTIGKDPIGAVDVLKQHIRTWNKNC